MEQRRRLARTAPIGVAVGLASLVASLLAGCGPGPARLVGAGDIASCDQSNDTKTAQLLDDIPGHVVALGDNAYENGTLSEYRNCYGPNWGRHNGRVRPVPGNHEADSGFNGYFDYYGSKAGPGRRGYYFYDVGAWRVFALNSERDQAAQANYVRANDGGKACIAAYWHEPFVSGTHDRPSGQVRPLWEAMHDVGGDLVLAGHDHHYERFARLGRSGTASASGMREFVVGTGGKSLAGFNHVLSGSQVRARAYGVLVVDLRAGGYSWRFRSIPGTNFSDSGSESCR